MEWWRERLADDTDLNAKFYRSYLPKNMEVLGSTPKHVDTINTSPKVPRLQWKQMTYNPEFMQLYLLDFLYCSGLHNSTQLDALRVLAGTLLTELKDCNIGHVVLFFYRLRHQSVIKVDWKEWFGEQKIIKAVKMFKWSLDGG